MSEAATSGPDFASSNRPAASQQQTSDENSPNPGTQRFKFRRVLSVDPFAQHGYPRLATHMGNTVGAAIYRRFVSANARILLYRQAEITWLEHELNHLEELYQDEKHLRHRVGELKAAPAGSNGALLWAKVKELDDALSKYNYTLLQQKRLYELPKADDLSVKELYNFVHREESGGRWLDHPEDTIWEVDDQGRQLQKDLVLLSGGFHNRDAFTRFLAGPLLEAFHSIYKRFRVGTFYTTILSQPHAIRSTISVLPGTLTFRLIGTR
ncbi:MAG: hypothetical protein Q9157_000257 [Trypethelium eluteriae]